MQPLPKRSARIDQFELDAPDSLERQGRKLPATRPPPRNRHDSVATRRPSNARKVPPAFPKAPPVSSGSWPKNEGTARSSAMFFESSRASRDPDSTGDQDVTTLMPAPSRRTMPPPPEARPGRVPAPFPPSRRRDTPRPPRPRRDEECTVVRPDLSASAFTPPARLGSTPPPKRTSAPPAPPSNPAPPKPPPLSGPPTLVGVPRPAMVRPPVDAMAHAMPAHAMPAHAMPAHAMPVSAQATQPAQAVQATQGDYAYPYFATTRPNPVMPNAVAPMAMPVRTAAARLDSPAGLPAAKDHAAAAKKSDPNVEGRPTISWVAVFVALGVLTGLLIALFVRGDGEAALEAMASYIDSARSTSAATQANRVPGEVLPAAPAVPSAAATDMTNAPPAPPPPPAFAPQGSAARATAALAHAAPPPWAGSGALGTGVVKPVPPGPAPVKAHARAASASRSESSRSETVAMDAPKLEKIDRGEKSEKSEKSEKTERSEKSVARAEKSSRGGAGGAADKEEKEKEKYLAEAATKLADQQLEQSLAQ
ncbi:hypothetical protein [Pendulispora albinea]|uniref:Uncharacterized protein n=1 Tax=Pendulispora albinea TaxID=2741071 RepID=A0ABZ2M8H5_9BACT